ncbi:hypothetical protein BJ912DRAFT_1048452 [Pholiota molesta]|nr:hypothetical protein BJ912DRAFT_1048452 [Pholiota molesta]
MNSFEAFGRGAALSDFSLAVVLGANHIRTECGCLPQHMYPSRTWTVRGRTSDRGSHHHSRAHGTIVNRRMWEETMPANQTLHFNSEKQTRPTGSWRLSVEYILRRPAGVVGVRTKVKAFDRDSGGHKVICAYPTHHTEPAQASTLLIREDVWKRDGWRPLSGAFPGLDGSVAPRRHSGRTYRTSKPVTYTQAPTEAEKFTAQASSFIRVSTVVIRAATNATGFDRVSISDEVHQHSERHSVSTVSEPSGANR